MLTRDLFALANLLISIVPCSVYDVAVGLLFWTPAILMRHTCIPATTRHTQACAVTIIAIARPIGLIRRTAECRTVQVHVGVTVA